MDEKICPKCGSGNVASILWGKPEFGDDLQREIDAGKVVLGDSRAPDGGPAYRCNSCGTDWGRRPPADRRRRGADA